MKWKSMLGKLKKMWGFPGFCVTIHGSEMINSPKIKNCENHRVRGMVGPTRTLPTERLVVSVRFPFGEIDGVEFGECIVVLYGLVGTSKKLLG